MSRWNEQFFRQELNDFTWAMKQMVGANVGGAGVVVAGTQIHDPTVSKQTSLAVQSSIL